jgi:putative membrane protein
VSANNLAQQFLTYPVFAHELIGARALAPDESIHAWTFEPGVTIPLAVVSIAYGVGLFRLWRVAGVGRGISGPHALAFFAGCASIVVALMSPLDAISAALFSAHMAQHEVLMLVAAPLTVIGSPLIAFLWLLPAPWRKRVGAIAQRPAWLTPWHAVTAPLTVWVLHAAALWVWHLPSLYNEWIHASQHACFFGTAALFWWGLTHGRYGRLGYGAAVLFVFSTAMHSGILGALLTLSPGLWYPIYAATSGAWGLTPLEDQQLAGLIMWVPAGVLFVAGGLLFFSAWLRESDRRVRRL